ncbi:MAG: response regulator [Pseudomonadota bacterium]
MLRNDQDVEELYLDYARLVLLGYGSCAACALAVILCFVDRALPIWHLYSPMGLFVAILIARGPVWIADRKKSQSITRMRRRFRLALILSTFMGVCFSVWCVSLLPYGGETEMVMMTFLVVLAGMIGCLLLSVMPRTAHTLLSAAYIPYFLALLVMGTKAAYICGGMMIVSFLAATSFARRHQEKTDKLLNAVTEAQSAVKTKANFLANMSHEIRTPMNGVIGMTDLLMTTQLDAKQKDLANIIKSSGNSLLNVINDILDFSKFESGKVDLQAQSFNLRRAVEDVVILVSATARKKNLEVIFDFHQNCPEGFIGDNGRIRQILTNLIGNAVKFTETGHVVVRVSSTVNDNDARVRFEVTDTGIGIPEDKLARIFDQFEQVDTSSTRQFEGTGLGLAIARSIVDLMDGELGVDSKLGAGSTFWFEVDLPLDHDIQTGRAMDDFDIKGTRVLILDDNEINRRMLVERCAGWGLETVEANSALQAMAALYAASSMGKPIALVISDYQMPEINGEEFVIKIQADEQFCGIPIIITSSVGERTQIEQRGKAHVDAWLVKPVRNSLLLESIITALFKKSIREIKATSRQLKAAAVPRRASYQTNASYSLLVAEDNAINQLVLQTMLAETEFRVHMVGNGADAVAAFEKLSPDCVLMDMSMPIMGGIEAAEKIRALEAGTPRHTPIIAVTANVMERDRTACIKAGMDAFVAKPIDRQLLLACLRKQIAQDAIATG